MVNWGYLLQKRSGQERIKQEMKRKSEQLDSSRSLITAVSIIGTVTVSIILMIVQNNMELDGAQKFLILITLLAQIKCFIIAVYISAYRKKEFYLASPEEVKKELEKEAQPLSEKEYHRITVSNIEKRICMLKESNKERTRLLDVAFASIVIALISEFLVVILAVI